MNFTIGADPEFFVSQKGVIKSAEGLIGGSKKKPLLFDQRGFYMQEDNVMVEFNIPPASGKQEFVDNINFAKDYLTTLLKMKGYEPAYVASAKFTKEELSTKQAKMFGCAPEYNVYTEMLNPRINARDYDHRFSGGHVHIGFDAENDFERGLLIKALDYTLGIPALFLDDDTKRREAYGKAGSCRFTDYGVEYRVLSNFWIKDSKGPAWVYDSVRKAFEIMYDIDFLTDIEKKLVEAINTQNYGLAQYLVEEFDKELKLI